MNPGPYGIADDDPKAVMIRDLGGIVKDLKVKPVIIDGIAVVVNGHKRQTVDVDLLVARDEAVKLIRSLEASTAFSKVRIDRFKHNSTRAGVDLCVEGELTSPYHTDRFPSPDEVEQIQRDPLAVVGLTDLLVLKAKSARAQDEADFIRLYMELGLSGDVVERIRAKLQDPRLRENVDRWHARALEEIERDKLRRPPKLE